MILGRIMVEEDEKFVLPHHDGWINMEKVSKKMYTDMIYNETKRQMKEYHNLNEGFKIEIKSRELTNLNQILLDF